MTLFSTYIKHLWEFNRPVSNIQPFKLSHQESLHPVQGPFGGLGSFAHNTGKVPELLKDETGFSVPIKTKCCFRGFYTMARIEISAKS